MSWGGSDAPCAFGTLGSIGQINAEANKNTMALLTAHFKQIGVPGDRLYIKFENIKPENCGYNGTTFKQIMG